MTISELNEMAAASIAEAELSELTDIKSITLDAALPIEHRFQRYLGEVHNPYLFRCGDTIVKLSFSEYDATVDQAITVYLSELKNL